MTDSKLPILADGLFDGGLAADVAPKDLRAAVNVLSAAGRPGSDAELASMAARVRQLSAEINAAAKPPARATTPTPAAFGDTRRASDTSVSADTQGDNPMFATRITRKALTIVAITLLAAGTAAAAAGGALPMFEDDPQVVVHDEVDTKVIDDFDQSNDQSNDDSPPVTQPRTVATVRVDEQSPLLDGVSTTTTTTTTTAGKPAEDKPGATKPAAAPPDDATDDSVDDSVDNSDDDKSGDDKPSTEPADDGETDGGGSDGHGHGNGHGNGNGSHGDNGDNGSEHGNGNGNGHHGSGNGNGHHGSGK